jgi:hypothetical protein
MYGLFTARSFCLSMNKNVLVLYLGQRYPKYKNSFGKNEGMNQRWNSWFQRKPQSPSSIEPCHTSQHPLRVSRLMALELRRRGDFRDVDDLSDFEFNDIYLDAIPGSLELMDDTDSKISALQSIIGQADPSFLQPQMYKSRSSSWAPYKYIYIPLALDKTLSSPAINKTSLPKYA